ncbi:hypothetical protein [Mycobacteroides abscessus]|uniref:hypothetical protein n=1 Tax=Mycobacteroides abscessus TaxID=36809 RepID=UPI000929DA6E|nr:hypothetical protein [Mycobacteroides abscessus]DAZ90311.1 TPA_asm: hypothetical protein PROPHIFSQJ01-1_25 [Mycobacterium phage prophiFSQJ01-1]SII40557.1 Uncharacterised protein [Mycobacteroides abscessus subsp. abscessus]SIK14689.1 Uncharacterised protein [Mycobacteroides abscessus subsp. abscessus]SIN25079.1 Uncharacterised protein [Mycobacteroides abscessus subsp. abscessus]SLI51848.1 Uncharacterised protein [Mycobacteroides abscessus subsp. abscessus]
MNRQNECTDHVHVSIKEISDEVLLEIWLDGFASGAMSLMANAIDGDPDGPTEERQLELAHAMVASLMNDPVAVATTRKNIFARMTVGNLAAGVTKIDSGKKVKQS